VGIPKPWQVERIREGMKKMAPTDRAAHQFDAVKKDFGRKTLCGSRIQWTLPVPSVADPRVNVTVACCQPLWQHTYMISPSKLQEFRELAKNNHVVLPEPPPRHQRTSDEMAQADLWFLEQYKEARPQAETIEEGEQGQGNLPNADLAEMDLIEVDDHPLWMQGILAGDGISSEAASACRKYVRKKYMEHQTFQDIYSKQCADAGAVGATPVSYSTLERVYKQRW
jgi:hypothetical protein